MPPLFFGMFVVVMPQAYFELLARGEIGPGIVEFYGDYLWPFDDYSIITPTWNHLWYLAYALVYSLLMVVGYRVLGWLGARIGPVVSAALARTPWLILLVPALPGALYALTLDPHFPSTHMMVNDWADHAHYLTLLVFGWFAARSSAFWSAVAKCMVPALLVALALGVVLTLTRTGDVDAITPFQLTRDVIGEFYAWSVIIAALGLGQRFLNRPSRVLTYATEAVLPWYILHQTITVAIGFAFIGSGAPLWIEAPVVVFGTVAGCLVIHDVFVRRIPWLRRLFGVKPVPASLRLNSSDPRRTNDASVILGRSSRRTTAPQAGPTG